MSQPYVARSYLAPERDSGEQEKAAALVYLAELLGGSPFTSVLGMNLQFDTNTAVFTNAGYSGTSLDDTTFNLSVAPAEGVTLQEAEDAMDDAIQSFMDTDIDPDRMEAIRTQLRASEVYALDDVQGLANRYGAALSIGLTVEDVQEWPAILEAVTAEDVKAIAEEVLDPRRSVTMWVSAEEESAE